MFEKLIDYLKELSETKEEKNQEEVLSEIIMTLLCERGSLLEVIGLYKETIEHLKQQIDIMNESVTLISKNDSLKNNLTDMEKTKLIGLHDQASAANRDANESYEKLKELSSNIDLTIIDEEDEEEHSNEN